MTSTICQPPEDTQILAKTEHGTMPFLLRPLVQAAKAGVYMFLIKVVMYVHVCRHDMLTRSMLRCRREGSTSRQPVWDAAGIYDHY
jgi:hypothetical protein